jgi:hypothetical protein
VASDARRNPDWIAFGGSHSSLTRSAFLGEATRLSARLPKTTRSIGLLLPNSREWAVAQIATAIAPVSPVARPKLAPRYIYRIHEVCQ